MSKAAQQSEPSMEEILASIRKIISDENDAPAPEAAKPAENPAPEPAPAAEKAPEPEKAAEAKAPPAPEEPTAEAASDDIFELTDDMVAEAPKKVEPVPPEVDFDGDISFDDTMATEAEPEPVAEEPAKPEETGAAAIADRLISPATDAAVGSAFGKLANTILSRDSHTLEDLVKEMLRPMLQEWLDDNLPGMVEKLVREEIERVSRGR